MKTLRRAAWLLVLPALLTQSGRAGQRAAEVNVNVDLTPEGRKLTLPTRDHPAYYFPLVGGYRQEGAGKAGEKIPDRSRVLHEVARTLAGNGYLVTGPKTPAPSVLLVFYWGSMNPDADEVGDPGESHRVFFNQKKMVALVGGQTLPNLDLFSEREAVMQGAEDDRYFLMIAAYDFAAAQAHKKVLLWRTKMSTPADGVDFSDVLTALITSGGPLLGHETLRPVWVNQPLEPKGTVKLHELEVKEYLEPAPAGKTH